MKVYKLKWVKWLFIMLPLTISMGPCQFASTCKTGTIPDPPTEKYFTIEVTYIRTQILQPDRAEFPVGMAFCAGSSRRDLTLTLIDNYHLKGEVYQLVSYDPGGCKYDVFAVDTARHNGVDDGTCVVGDIFILKVKETGAETQLTNIVQNISWCNPFKTPSARMAICVLRPNGTITNN